MNLTIAERTTWILNNHDKLHELDPECNERIKKSIRDAHPIYTANIIQGFAKDMQLCIDGFPGINRPVKRAEQINTYISLIDEILRPEGYATAIETAAVDSVRAELIEWRGILTGMLSGNKSKPTTN